MAQTEERLSRTSPLYWLVLATALGFMLIGIGFLVAPRIASEGFGIPLDGGPGLAFARVKGIRDIFAGLVVLPFLFRGERRAVAWVMLTATLIPIVDGFIVLNSLGAHPLFLSIHWGAAVYFIVVDLFLYRVTRNTK